MWTERQKALWTMLERKLEDLNKAHDNHRGLRSGEIPSKNPDAACQSERLNMLLSAQSLAFDLSCLIKSEIES